MARYAALEVPRALQEALLPVIELLQGLAPRMAAADGWARQAAADDAITRRLMTAPGVGPITALHYRAALDAVARFRSAGAATAYLGLVPREDSSGDRHHRGAITKTGPPRPRTMRVQACWVIWRTPAAGSATLPAWVRRLAERRGRRIAIVALARRLARILFAMWRDGEDFTATRRPAAARAA